MIRRFIHISAFLVLLANQFVFGLSGNPIDGRDALAPFLATTEAEINLEKWDSFLAKLGAKSNQYKDDRQFLEFIFYRTHQVFLKHYTQATSFDEIFTTGTYNCLSGTILYSVILTHFGIQHDIIETNYHIFILAQTSQGEVLLETTDGFDGFVTSDVQIRERIAGYQKRRNKKDDHYEFSFDLFNKVSEKELIGLLYYNYAVDSFNKQDFKKAVHYLSLTTDWYATIRIEEFSEVLLWALVSEDRLNAEEKQSLKKQLQIIRYRALPTVANL